MIDHPDELGPEDGDDLNVAAASRETIEVEAAAQAVRQALARMRARNWTLPEGYRFDREGANRR